MSRALALLCLAACLGAVMAAKPPAPSSAIFMDFLDWGAAPGTAKPSYYDGVETETVCMQLTSYCDTSECGTPNDRCIPYNWLGELGCTHCHPEGHYYDEREVRDLLGGPGNVAKCVFTEQNAGEIYLPEKPGVAIYGTFTAQCLIKDEKDSCGHPDACDNVVIQVSGVQYEIEKVVVDGPVSSVQDPTCATDSRRRSTSGGRKGRKSGSASIQAAAAYQPETVYTGAGYVYVGTMTVTSRHHPVKFDGGWFQYSYVNNATITTDPVAGLPRVQDNAFKFHFTSDKGHY